MKFFRVKPAKERKVVFWRKRWLAIPGALLCICALCLVTTLPSYVSASTTERQLPIYCVQRDYKTCALSLNALGATKTPKPSSTSLTSTT